MTNRLKPLVRIIFPFTLLFASCSQDADSTPDFTFKPPPRPGAIIKIADQVISVQEGLSGIEADIYDLEKKLFDLKYNHLKSLFIKKLVAKDPKIRGRSTDEFMEQEVLRKVKPSKKQVDDFIPTSAV